MVDYASQAIIMKSEERTVVSEREREHAGGKNKTKRSQVAGTSSVSVLLNVNVLIGRTKALGCNGYMIIGDHSSVLRSWLQHDRMEAPGLGGREPLCRYMYLRLL